MLSFEQEQSVSEAIALILRTPGYEEAARDLSDTVARGKMRFAADIEDRAHAGLTGVYHIGDEALNGSCLGLAETLIHERHHTHQNPLAKTASFWKGAFTGANIMRDYERPAYEAAIEFLQAVERWLPDLADEARQEQSAIRQVFLTEYGEAL